MEFPPDLSIYSFAPCWCTHEEAGTELSNQMWVSDHVIKTVRKCTKALKGQNALCAHQNLIHEYWVVNYEAIVGTIIRALKIPEKKRSELLTKIYEHLLMKLWLDQLKRSCHWTFYGSEDKNYDCMEALLTRPVLRIIFDRLEEISEIQKEKREEGKNKNIDTSKLQTEFDVLLVEAQWILWFEMRQLRDEVRVLAILCL